MSAPEAAAGIAAQESSKAGEVLTPSGDEVMVVSEVLKSPSTQTASKNTEGRPRGISFFFELFLSFWVNLPFFMVKSF